MASNVQAGTRGLSAGDWIRLKRLRGSREFQNDKDGDITNPSPTLLETTKGARHVFTEFGTSKIRRPASFWTDYRASQKADYVLETQDSNTKSRALTSNKVCTCSTTDAIKHAPICIACKHEKRTNLYPLAPQPSCTTCGS